MPVSVKIQLLVNVCLIANLAAGQASSHPRSVQIEAVDCGSKVSSLPEISRENSGTVLGLLMNDKKISSKPVLTENSQSLFYFFANKTSDTTTYIQAWDMASEGPKAHASNATSIEISQAVGELMIECWQNRKTLIKIHGELYSPDSPSHFHCQYSKRRH
jgi:hypothetical protein